MGCDIHVHVEIRVDGEWEHYNHPRVDRNYRVFTKMAGVRNGYDDIDPFPPKGFPEDASVTTTEDYEHWGIDAHTPSYLVGEELEAFRHWWDKEFGTEPSTFRNGLDFEHHQFGYIFGNGFRSWDSHCQVGLYPGDIRLVFWFDN